MMRFFSRFALALTAAIAVLPMAPSRAHAQNPQAINHAELRGSGAANLYEAVATLRPEWLLLAGDTADTEQAQRLVVFVNGRHVGNVLALRGLSAAQVSAVRLHGADYVRLNYPRFPRMPFTAAIFVSTRGDVAEPPPGRVTVTLDAGFSPASLGPRLSSALAAQGYDQQKFFSADGRVGSFQKPGTEFPLSIGGGVHYAVRDRWGVGLSALHTRESWAGAYNPESSQAVSATFRSTEGALLVSRQLGSEVRIGAGPAMRVVDWSWSRAFCQCVDEAESRTTAVGAAAEAAIRLRVRPWRALPQMRLQARYYPSQDASYSHVQDPLDVGGLVVTMSAGLATRF